MTEDDPKESAEPSAVLADQTTEPKPVVPETTRPEDPRQEKPLPKTEGTGNTEIFF